MFRTILFVLFLLSCFVRVAYPQELRIFRSEVTHKYGFGIQNAGVVISPIYEDVKSNFTEGLAAVKLHGKWGFIDPNGHEAIPFLYDDINPFSEGYAAVALNAKYGIIDKSGQQILPFQYDYSACFTKGW